MKRSVSVKKYNNHYLVKMKEGSQIVGAWNLLSEENACIFCDYFLAGHDIEIDIYGNLKTSILDMMKAKH